MSFRLIGKFLQLESASGIVLFAMALLALVWSNSPWAEFYQLWFRQPQAVFWINEGLMTLFFLLVGLEIKRELVGGEVANLAAMRLPLLAALGGMIVPALIYVIINKNNVETLSGWAIPVATDIAFSLGVLSLFGKRVPLSLKIFLMALAIFDDVGAIIIIAVYHTQAISYVSLLIATLIIFVMIMMNVMGIKRLLFYIIMGFLLWLSVLKSGVHATLAGVIVGFIIPHPQQVIVKLHPWVAYVVMPLFALANAGISFAGINLSMLLSTVCLGVAAGLFIGKQVGVLLFSWIAVRLRWAVLPAGVRWVEMVGVSLLCGIGFTMSLFLGTLSLQQSDIWLTEMRLGVLMGSLLSGIAGLIVLNIVTPRRPAA